MHNVSFVLFSFDVCCVLFHPSARRSRVNPSGLCEASRSRLMIYHSLQAAGLLALAYFTTAAQCAAITRSSSPIRSAKIFAGTFPSINVRIGTSETVLKVLVDTGSCLGWINPQKLTSPSDTTYDTSQSFNITYGTGSVAGHVAEDDIHIGLLGQLDLPSRSFGVADAMDAQSATMDGLFGLSLYDVDQQSYPGGWDMLSPQLSPRVIGLRMQQPLKHDDIDPEIVAGQIDYGGPDPHYVEQGITYVPVVPGKEKTAWIISVDDVHIDGQPLNSGAREAMLDTGSNGINLLPADAAAIMQTLGGQLASKADGSGIEWALPCLADQPEQTVNKKLEIQIGGSLFTVPYYLLLNGQRPESPSLCYSTLQGTAQDSWLLGQGFLQAVYSVWDFEKKRVGFASVPPLIAAPVSPQPPPTPVQAEAPQMSVTQAVVTVWTTNVVVATAQALETQTVG